QRIRTIDGKERGLDDAVIDKFASGLRGQLLRRGDPGYDAARKVWNGMVDKRPALIARCAGTSDVVDAVRFAREHDLLVSVRGGGCGRRDGKSALACDTGLSAVVVTADGRVLTVNADENDDLYWGIRGAGANLGIVTSFEYRLHPVGPVLGGMVIYPISKGRDV